MIPATRHAYLNTRVSVMATRLFGPTTLHELLPLPLPDLAARFGLERLLDESQPAATRSRAIEEALIQLLLTELQILIRPMNSDERALLLAWGRKYALLNLKTLIRGKLQALNQQELLNELFELPEIIRLPYQRLFRAENPAEMLRQLEAGPYRHIARQARKVYEQQHEPFALETSIDKRYYSRLAHQISAFSSADAEPLRSLIGSLLDCVALLWLLRFRFHYGLSPSETFYQLVPSMGALTRPRLLELVELDNLPQVLDALPAHLHQPLAGAADLDEVHRRVEAHTRCEIQALLRRSQSAPARALAYLILREKNLLALFAILHGRLLRLPQTTIEKALEPSLSPDPSAGGGMV